MLENTINKQDSWITTKTFVSQGNWDSMFGTGVRFTKIDAEL